MASYGRRSQAYVTFQARLEPELKERLVRCAEASGESQISIITGALREFLATPLGNAQSSSTEETQRHLV